MTAKMYHRITSLADEERLLEQKLALQSAIRAKRERKRRKRTHDTEVYSKMLEPVTKSIAKLHPSTTSTMPVVKQEPVKKEKEGEEGDEEDMGDDEVAEPETPHPVDLLLDADPQTPESVVAIKEENPDDDLYQEALAMVPRKFRDDGQLGLCPSTHQIGTYTYAVHGNTLQAVSNHDENEDMHQFEIRDLNLWKLLLVLNPSKIGLPLTSSSSTTNTTTTTPQRVRRKVAEYLPFVLDYVFIARKLDLLDSYTGSKARAKYTLLTTAAVANGGDHSGSGGFLFSSNPPPRIPSVVVLPPDNKGLMSELYRAVAELRAGNTTMRNLVAPMVREARRRHIHIPPDLLSPYEDTWTLA